MSAIFKINIDNKVTLNALNEGKFYLDPPIQGLEIPKIRTTRQAKSGAGGGFIPSQYFSMRVIRLVGRIFGDTASDMMTNRRELQTALAPYIDNQQSFPIYITIYDGSVLTTDVKLTDFKCELKRPRRTCPYLIMLESEDAELYDERSDNVANVATGGAGGYVTPYNMPYSWADSGGAVAVTNNGSARARPKIVLTGSHASNNSSRFVELRHDQSSRKLRINTAMVAGDTITLDFADRTVIRDRGGTITSLASSLSDDSVWWLLNSGDNEIAIETNTTSDTITAQIEWRTGYLGI